MIDIIEKDGALIFGVKVIPRSSNSMIIGAYDGYLKVKLSSPPVDGAANKELVKLFSKSFGIAKSRIEIVGGKTSSAKKVKFSGLTPDRFRKMIPD